MKRILAVYFCGFALIGQFQWAIIPLLFELNQSYIAEELCSFKEIEDNQCQGSCILDHALQQTNDADTTQHGNQAVSFLIQQLLAQIAVSEGRASLQEPSIKSFVLLPIEIQNHYESRFLKSHFRPPQS